MFSFALEVASFIFFFIWITCWEIVYFIFRNRPRKDIKNSHILITGTGQGMGRLLVERLAKDGNTLHIVDINTPLNAKTKADCENANCKIFAYHCDVGNLDAILKLKKDVTANCNGEHIQYLFNNAGIAVGKLFPEISLRELNLVMSVNAIGLMNMTKVFLDDMIEKGGHLILTSSLAGFLGAPYGVAYTASKHAVTGFSRALLYDFEYMGINHVKVTTIFPYFVNTGIATGVSLPWLFPMLDAEYVVDRIIIATREERNELVLPWISMYITPIWSYVMECRVFRRYCRMMGNDVMKTFRQTRTHHPQINRENVKRQA